MTDFGRRLRTIGVFCIVGALSLYGLYEARRYLEGPVIVITSPQEGALVEGPLVEVHGEGRNISYLYINGFQAYLNETGAIIFRYAPPPGYTRLEVQATDRFGRTEHTVVRFNVK